MASVEQTVRDTIETWPTLFTHRADVLHYILCCNGNGYEWRDGEPRNTFEGVDTRTWRERLGDMLTERLTFSVTDAAREGAREVYEEDLAACTQIIAEIDARCAMDGPVRPYAQSEQCLLMTMPADVRPDWAQACAQMREFAAQHGWTFPEVEAL